MDLFLIKLILAFIIGGVWVTLITVVAERFGTKLGGVIGGIPSTSVIVLFFVGFTQSPEIASEATTMLPLFFSLNGLFLILYVKLIRKGLFVGLVGSLAPWILLAGLIVLSGYENFVTAIIVWVASTIISYYIMEKRIKVKSKGKINRKYSLMQIISRALLAGSIMALGVFLAKIGGPIYGGIFSAFPTMYTSTLIITYLAHGKEFSRSIAKTMMICGMINIVIYAIAVRYLYLTLGLIYGTLVAFLISIVSSLFTNEVVVKNLI